MTGEMSKNFRGKHQNLKMTGLIPEVIPVRTKMSCPGNRAISQAKEMTDQLATPAQNKKNKAQASKLKTRTTMMTVIFDRMPIDITKMPINITKRVYIEIC